MITIPVLFAIAIYILTARSIARLVLRKTGSKKKYYLSIIAFMFLAAWDNIAGNAVFKYLCATDGGKIVYKTAESESVLMENYPYGCDDICERSLTDNYFKFIEVNVTRPSDSSYTIETGLHKFYVDSKGSNNCKAYEDYYAKNTDRRKSYLASKYNDKCIASEKINSIISKYSYKAYERDFPYIRLLNISKTQTRIVNIISGELLAKTTFYYYYGGWIATSLHLYGPGIGRKCPKDKTSENTLSLHETLLYDVFPLNVIKKESD